jgi:hypothetical protein
VVFYFELFRQFDYKLAVNKILYFPRSTFFKVEEYFELIASIKAFEIKAYPLGLG